MNARMRRLLSRRDRPLGTTREITLIFPSSNIPLARSIRTRMRSARRVCLRRQLELTVVFLLFVFDLPLSAQIQELPRQKIGLALSGGSALGLAHIGVLKYFDEHHIPIDYIAGTSMGGLVGGFYSTGLTSAELEQIAAHVDGPKC